MIVLVALTIAAIVYAAVVVISGGPRVNAPDRDADPPNPCWPRCTCAERRIARQRSRRGRAA